MLLIWDKQKVIVRTLLNGEIRFNIMRAYIDKHFEINEQDGKYYAKGDYLSSLKITKK